MTRDERAPAEFLEGEKHPDCRDVRPFAGAGETGISAGRSRGRRLLPPGKRPSGDARGARTAKEEGSFHGPFALRRALDLVARLRSGRSAHAHTQPSLDHPRRNRRWNRVAASHAETRRAAAFDAPPHDGLRRRGAAPTVEAWLAACPLSEGRGLSHAAGAERRRREAEDAQQQRAETPSCRLRARMDGSRSRSRVVVQGCRSRRTVLDAEKRPPLLSPDRRVVVDGRLRTRHTARERRRRGQNKHGSADRSGNLT